MLATLEPPEVRTQPTAGASDGGSRLAAILDLTEVRAHVSPLSVQAYEFLTEKGFLEKRAELIRGIIVKKMPESPLHRKLTKRFSCTF